MTAARCWLCGAPCPIPLDASAEPRCPDAGQCFVRSVAPPGAPAAVCLCGGKGYHASPDEDDPLDVYCACEAGTRRWKRETKQENNEEERR